MVPVTGDSHGYRVKAKYQHLLPSVLGRPTDYVMLPFCLPPHNTMYKKAMKDLELKMQNVDPADQYYPGSVNNSLQ